MLDDKRPRGLRNNNPLNIDRGQKWQGLMPRHQMTPEQKAETRFAVFMSPEWGIRAATKVIQTYRRKYGINTIRGIVGRWAPPTENDTDAYVDRVVNIAGIPADEILDLTDSEILRRVLCGMITVELGHQPFSTETLLTGIQMAGLPAPAPKPVHKSKRAVGAAVTVAAPGAIAALGKVREVIDAAKAAVQAVLPGVPDDGDWKGIAAVLGLALAGFVGYTLWTLFVDRRAERMDEEIM